MNRRSFLYTILGSAVILPFAKMNIFAEGKLFPSIMLQAQKQHWNKKNINEILVSCAKSFLELPYIGGSLEGEGESLRYSFEGFDCVTLYETSLALARTIKKEKFTLNDFEEELTFIRYRGGAINNYPSRLHYTSEWIIDNVKKNVVNDITKEIGGIEFDNQVGFMSGNPKYYKALQDNPEYIEDIKKNEAAINSTKRYYIPTESIKKSINKIHSGDIIAITTSKAGLDYSHTGIAYKESRRILSMLHASSKHKKVIIEKDLVEYLEGIKSNTGISVLRPIWK